jgi:hypothetical protein
MRKKFYTPKIRVLHHVSSSSSFGGAHYLSTTIVRLPSPRRARHHSSSRGKLLVYPCLLLSLSLSLIVYPSARIVVAWPRVHVARLVRTWFPYHTSFVHCRAWCFSRYPCVVSRVVACRHTSFARVTCVVFTCRVRCRVSFACIIRYLRVIINCFSYNHYFN